MANSKIREHSRACRDLARISRCAIWPSRSANGDDVVNFMVFGGSVDAREAICLRLDHGANSFVVDAQVETAIRHVYNEPETLRALVDHGAAIDRIQSDGSPAIVH